MEQQNNPPEVIEAAGPSKPTLESADKAPKAAKDPVLLAGVNAQLRLYDSNLFHLYQGELVDAAPDQQARGPEAICVRATIYPMLHLKDSLQSIVEAHPMATHFEAIIALHRLQDDKGNEDLQALEYLLRKSWARSLQSLKLWITGYVVSNARELYDSAPVQPEPPEMTLLDTLWPYINGLSKLTELHLDVQLYKILDPRIPRSIKFFQVQQVTKLPLEASLLAQLHEFHFTSNAFYVWNELIEGFNLNPNQLRSLTLDQLQFRDELLRKLPRELLERTKQLAVYIRTFKDLHYMAKRIVPVCGRSLTSLRLVNQPKKPGRVVSEEWTLVMVLELLAQHAQQLVTLRYEWGTTRMVLGFKDNLPPKQLLPTLKTFSLRVQDKTGYSHRELDASPIITRLLPHLQAYQIRIECDTWCTGHFRCPLGEKPTASRRQLYTCARELMKPLVAGCKQLKMVGVLINQRDSDPDSGFWYEVKAPFAILEHNF